MRKLKLTIIFGKDWCRLDLFCVLLKAAKKLAKIQKVDTNRPIFFCLQATMGEELTFNNISLILQHLDLVSYLDFKSIIELSSVSSTSNKIVNYHISHNTKALFWSTSDSEDSVWKVYKPTKLAWSLRLSYTKHTDPIPIYMSEPQVAHQLASQPLINIAAFPKDTQFITCALEMKYYYLEGLQKLTHLNITKHTRYQDGDYMEQPAQQLYICIDYLPSSITHLTFNNCYDETVDHLPPKITHLSLSNSFRKNIDHLPQTLTHLWLGVVFNRSVDYLPQSLTHLFFHNLSNFDEYIDHLPTTLSYLSLGKCFDKPIDNLPPNLQILKFNHGTFASYWFSFYMDHLPMSLKKLKLPRKYNKTEYLPPNVVLLLPNNIW